MVGHGIFAYRRWNGPICVSSMPIKRFVSLVDGQQVEWGNCGGISAQSAQKLRKSVSVRAVFNSVPSLHQVFATMRRSLPVRQKNSAYPVILEVRICRIRPRAGDRQSDSRCRLTSRQSLRFVDCMTFRCITDVVLVRFFEKHEFFAILVPDLTGLTIHSHHPRT